MAAVGRGILLVSSDGEEFELSDLEACQSPMVGWKAVLCVDGPGGALRRIRILLRGVDGATLARVVEFCRVHSPRGAFAFNDADERFVRGLDRAELFGLLVAADGLRMRALIQVLHWRVADITAGRTSREVRLVRRIFRIWRINRPVATYI